MVQLYVLKRKNIERYLHDGYLQLYLYTIIASEVFHKCVIVNKYHKRNYVSSLLNVINNLINFGIKPILIDLSWPNIGCRRGQIPPPPPPPGDKEIIHIQGCVTHVSGPTFRAQSNGRIESLRPLQGKQGLQ